MKKVKYDTHKKNNKKKKKRHKKKEKCFKKLIFYKINKFWQITIDRLINNVCVVEKREEIDK